MNFLTIFDEYKIFHFQRQVDEGIYSDEAMSFLSDTFGYVNLNESNLKELLFRPIRVCGMVINEGQPGGGPFYVKDKITGTSLQIVEAAELDKTNSDHIKALEMMVTHDELPCNVKFMIEGEEEVGSDNLELFIQKHKEKLANDVILISDTGMISNTQPSITTGLRGLSYMEVVITGPNRDLHSGLYGGAVANPINILTQMIAQLHDANNRITIPGFYEGVEDINKEERAEMAKAPFSLEDYKNEIKIPAVHGETGYTTLERNSIRPTLDVNGIWGGYTGEGAKTVIASKAHAKISMRLVPGQDWEVISDLFTKHFKSIAPESVSVEIIKHHGGQAYVTPTDNIGYQAAHKAYAETFGTDPIPQKGGGSIPIVPLFEDVLGTKSVLMGFGLDSDAIHSPNEHFGLFNFFKGIETIPLFYKHYVDLVNENKN